MNDQVEVLLLVARRLDETGIAYMISGSTAMNFYARPRMTRDIDIVVELHSSDARRLHETFADAFYIDEEAVSDAIARRGMFNAIHNDTLVKVDFIVLKNELYRQTEFQRSKALVLGSLTLSVVAPEDLILSKLLWSRDSGSATQENDVRNLLAHGSPDTRYLESWAAKLGVADRLAAMQS